MNRLPMGRAKHLLNNLVSDYDRHLRAYEQWLAVAREAAEKLDAGELDEFLAVHERKQAIADGLQDEERLLREHRRRVKSELGLEEFTLQHLEDAASSSDDEAFRSAVAMWRRLLERLTETMQHVAKAERRIEVRLKEHLRSLSTSVDDARRTRRAVRAYHPGSDGGADARFIDRKS